MSVAGWLIALALLAVVVRRERSARSRAELVARACHELRGPLTAAGLALYAAGRRDELALTDLALAPRGDRARDQAQPLAIADVLAAEAESWRGVAWAHGCELVLAQPLPDVHVRADARRLSQAAGNLIANALEHGAGTVRLGARADGARVRIEVCDDGPGLAAPIAALSRPRGTRGRGLAIVAEVAQRAGGALHSAPSAGGARLIIELPAAS